MKMGLLDDNMRATPRKSPALGLLSDAIGAIDGFIRKPFGYDNPPAGLLSDALSIPQIRDTIDRMSYGDPLTTGNGMTARLRPEAEASAFALAPVVAKYPRAAAALALSSMPHDATAANKAMNILFKKQASYADRAKVLADGTIEIPTNGMMVDPMYLYKDQAFQLANEKYTPKYSGFFRFTNNPDESAIASAGKLRNSINHADGVSENGVSVADGAHYSAQGYKYGYLVDGEIIGYGSDGEPLLNPASIKVMSGLMPAKEIMKSDKAARAKILKENKLPDDYLDTFKFLNDPLTFMPR